MNTIKINVRKNLLRFLLPTLSGMLVTFLFQLVDTFFIGKLGTVELTAIGFTYPLYTGMISVFMGLSAGIGAAVGQAVGEKDINKIRSMTTAGFILSAITSIAVSAILYMLRYPIYTLLGASVEIMTYIDAYMGVIIMGAPLLAITINLIASLRATGKALLPEILMGIGGLINLVLDYLLIFGTKNIPAMGIRGAAVATVLSWLIILIMIMVVAIYNRLFDTKISAFTKSSSKIFAIALPAIGVQMIIPFAIAVMTSFIAQFGPDAIAAFGIATKIETLGLTLILSLSVILVPIMANHYGASEQKHMDQVIILSGKISTYWSVILYLLFFLFARSIAGIFTTSASIIEIVRQYLLIIGLSYPLYNIATLTNSLFNAVNQSKKSLSITLVKYIVVLIPALYVGRLFGLHGLFIALATTHVIGGLIASYSFKKWLREEKSELADANLFNEYSSDIKSLFKKKH